MSLQAGQHEQEHNPNPKTTVLLPKLLSVHTN